MLPSPEHRHPERKSLNRRWSFALDPNGQGPAVRVGGNNKGVFTRDRQPKAAAFALRRRWRKDL